jgi:hypothetical protein
LSAEQKVCSDQNGNFILRSKKRQGDEDKKHLFISSLDKCEELLPSSFPSLLDTCGQIRSQASTTPEPNSDNFTKQNLGVKSTKDRITIDIYKSPQALNQNNTTPETQKQTFPKSPDPKNKPNWDRKHRKLFHRIKSGLERHKGQTLRFLTLTTCTEPKKDLRTGWQCLKGRIRRLTPARLVKQGYLTLKEARHYYRGLPINEPLPFEYTKVQTAEGPNGVYHVPYFGTYIPQKWLSDNWQQITGAKIVDIRACQDKVRDTKRLARYVVTQYVSGQDALIRFSWSWEWCFKGFVGVWHFLWRHCQYDTVIPRWQALLHGKIIPIQHLKGRYRVSMSGIFQYTSGRWINVKQLKSKPIGTCMDYHKHYERLQKKWQRKNVDLTSFTQAQGVIK